MDSRESLTIVVPMHNEVLNARRVICELLSSFSASELYLQVVAVDDGSTDGTGAVLSEMAAKCNQLIVARHAARRGYGSAIRTGIEHSNGELLGWIDGDGQYNPDDIHRLIDGVRSGSVAAVGVRRERADPIYRRLLGRIGTALASRICGHGLQDADAGLKVFDRTQVNLSGLRSRGGYVSTECLQRSFAVGAVSEIPIEHRHRTSGAQSGASFRVLLGLLVDFLRCEFRTQRLI